MFKPREDLKPDTLVKIQYKTEDGWVIHHTLPFASEAVGVTLSIINDQITRFGYSLYRVTSTYTE